jgi:CTP:molybdopterin cytidylyltransferase MocA
VTLAEPAPAEQGPAAQMARGADVARGDVHETDAVLLWPARLTWVGPETITSLIELHGIDPDVVLRPTWDDEPGWPIVLPVAALPSLRAVAADRMPADVLADVLAAGIRDRLVDLGDPGVTFDRDTARADLPPYIGPLEPVTGHVHEWGATVAEASDDAPLEGPALAPFGQAAEPAD